ncbi:MAG: CxxC-x17-CxxC domain-containing protein [Nitrososphaerales archaeon]
MSYGNRGNNRNRTGTRDRSGGNSNFGRPPRIMRDVTCSDCGKKTQVPFEPIEGRPVYCMECLPKHRAPNRSL